MLLIIRLRKIDFTEMIHRITQHCRNLMEEIGKAKKYFMLLDCTRKLRKIKYLFFVHGQMLRGGKSRFMKAKLYRIETITLTIFFKTNGWETTETNELGRINRMDPLGITNFRIRGMWEIENPLNVFSYAYNFNEKARLFFGGYYDKGKIRIFSGRR